MMKKRLTDIFLLIITAIILSSYQLQGKVNATPIVTSVVHKPTFVTYQTSVSIEVYFEDDSNITSILIQYCSLEPEFVCHFPKIAMAQQAGNMWNGTFTVLESDGIIGYELYVTFNEEVLIIPNASDYLGYENIAEPIEGTFYFTITLNQSTATDNSTINPIMILVTIPLMVLLIKVKQKKNKK